MARRGPPRSERPARDRTGRKGPRRARPEPPDRLERDPAARPPVVAIVGRPNVGKSTLLNALAGTRVAIVEPTAGVTRDRISVLATLAERTVELVDTGGVGIVDRQGLADSVERQVKRALEEASAILFVVDAREGLVPLDRRVADLLRRATAPVLLVANKVESERAGWSLGEFEALGHGEPLAVSAKERRGLADLEARLEAVLPEGPTTPRRLAAPELRLALVGRRNAGKSSLVNVLLGTERMIVSEVPGTTRDSVDLRLERDGKAVVLIDTAGIRKERAVHDSVEFYAQRRAERAMRRADVSALVLDAAADVGRLDRRIAAYALEHHHPVIVVANKWDLKPPGVQARAFRRYLHQTLPGLRAAPLLLTSAKTGRRVDDLLAVAWRLREQARTRVSTAEVNRALAAAQARRAPRPRHGRRGHVYYGTQVDVGPPTFVLFVNDRDLFDANWLRYLENALRRSLPFPEVPLCLRLRRRARSPARGGDAEAS